MIREIWINAFIFISAWVATSLFTKRYETAFHAVIPVVFFSVALTYTFWGK